MTDFKQHERTQVFVGVDVGKGAHHAVALDRTGKRLLDGALPNDETKLRALIGRLKEHGQDAYIIAEAARSLPHTLRSLKLADNELAELTMLCGFDDGLAGQITQTSNGIRGLLKQIHPALERVLGPHLDHPAMLDLLERYPSPAQLASISEKQLANRLVKFAPRMGKRWATEIVQALSEQTVVVPGTQAATIVLPRLAQQLAALRRSARKSRRKLSASCLLTLFIGPDQHAGSRRQDRRQTPDRCGEPGVRLGGPSGRLRRPCAGHAALRLFHRGSA